MDGTVGVYDLDEARWIWRSEGGHTETIFDCHFHPINPDHLASCSFDGTVKVHDIGSGKLVKDVNMETKAALYALCWNPDGKGQLAAGTSTGNVVIADMEKGIAGQSFQMHNKEKVFHVAWNPHDNNMIASGGADGNCVVFRPNGAKPGAIVWAQKHPSIVFGCDWNPSNPNILATGCGDGAIRIFDITKSSQDSLLAQLGPGGSGGHTKKVFNVLWSPFRTGRLLSSSDDLTARVWDYQQNAVVVLQGHTMNVRGVHWCHSIPHICLSGSWDNSIKVWDTRTGQCLYTVSDHGGDVYGVDASPMRPFCFASSSRDTTIRIWTLQDFVSDIAYALVAGLPADKLVADGSVAQEDLKIRPKLCGHAVHKIVKALSDDKADALVLPMIAKYFCAPEGTRDLMQILLGHVTKTAAGNPDAEVFRVEDAEQNAEMRIAELNRKRMIGRKHEQRVHEVAKLQLELGRVQEFCESMVSIDEWEKALAFAPACSMVYWQELKQRYAQKLAEEGAEEAPLYMIASGQPQDSVDYFVKRESFRDALTIAASCSQNMLPSCVDKKPETRVASSIDGKQLLQGVAKKMGTVFEKRGQPIQVACSQLANGQEDAAIQTLVCTREPVLAYILCRMLKRVMPNALLGTSADSCSRLNSADIGLALAKQVRNGAAVVEKVCATYPAKGNRDTFYSSAGLRSPASFADAGSASLGSGDVYEAVRCFVLAGDAAQACKAGLTALNGIIQDQVWDYSPAHQIIKRLGCLQLDVVEEGLRKQVLAYATFLGLMEAIWRGYCPILYGLNQSLEKLWDALPAQQKDVIQNLVCKFDIHALNCIMPGAHTTGTQLPSAAFKPTTLSVASGRSLTGSPVLLDDGSVMTLSEAVMWQSVNPFAPSNSGRRLLLS